MEYKLREQLNKVATDFIKKEADEIIEGLSDEIDNYVLSWMNTIEIERAYLKFKMELENRGYFNNK